MRCQECGVFLSFLVSSFKHSSCKSEPVVLNKKSNKYRYQCLGLVGHAVRNTVDKITVLGLHYLRFFFFYLFIIIFCAV